MTFDLSLSPRDWIFHELVASGHGSTNDQLLRATGLEPTELTVLVDELTAAQLLGRSAPTADLISLTERGVVAASDAVEKVKRAFVAREAARNEIAEYFARRTVGATANALRHARRYSSPDVIPPRAERTPYETSFTSGSHGFDHLLEDGTISLHDLHDHGTGVLRAGVLADVHLVLPDFAEFAANTAVISGDLGYAQALFLPEEDAIVVDSVELNRLGYLCARLAEPSTLAPRRDVATQYLAILYYSKSVSTPDLRSWKICSELLDFRSGRTMSEDSADLTAALLQLVLLHEYGHVWTRFRTVTLNGENVLEVGDERLEEMTADLLAYKVQAEILKTTAPKTRTNVLAVTQQMFIVKHILECAAGETRNAHFTALARWHLWAACVKDTTPTWALDQANAGITSMREMWAGRVDLLETIQYLEQEAGISIRDV